MKKFAVSLAVAAGAAFGFGAVASAQTDGYPPDTTVAPTTTDQGQVPPSPTTTAAPTTAAPTTTDAGAGPATPTTVAPGIPATGSDSTGTITAIAIGLVALGGGLYVVARARRDDDPAPA